MSKFFPTFPSLPTFVGFDSLFDTLNTAMQMPKVSNWPPFNVKKEDDKSYTIEFALAGFDKNDINITVEDDQLVVRGKTEAKEDNYLYKGISTRSFEERFTMMKGMKVQGAEYTNGILKVMLDGLVTISNSVKQIPLK